MISSPAEESSTQHADQFQDDNSPKPGWFKRKLLKLTEWWPVTMIAVPATILACLPYTMSIMATIREDQIIAYGFAALGVFVNITPPIFIWAIMKWVR